MTVVSTEQDTQALTLTLVAELAAPPERVWQVWADARQLERWWGPPTWPATFTELDLTEGGRAAYYMTGPEGEKAHGWWEFTAVDAPRALAFRDGFADAEGTPVADMPETSADVALEAAGPGTRMTITSRFASVEQMEQLVAMGMVEGLTGAVGQIDDILASTPV